jgi:hypothetical protein
MFWYPLVQSTSFIGFSWWEWELNSFDRFNPNNVSAYQFFIQMVIVATSPIGGVGFLVVFLNFQPKAKALVVDWLERYCPLVLRIYDCCAMSCCGGKKREARDPVASSSSSNSTRVSSSSSSSSAQGDTVLNPTNPRPSAVFEGTGDDDAADFGIQSGADEEDCNSDDEESRRAAPRQPRPISDRKQTAQEQALLRSLHGRLTNLEATDEDALCKIIDDVGRQLSIASASDIQGVNGPSFRGEKGKSRVPPPLSPAADGGATDDEPDNL